MHDDTDTAIATAPEPTAPHLELAGHPAPSEAGHSHVPTHYPPRTKWRMLIAAAAVLVGLAAAFTFRYIFNAREEAPLAAEMQKAANEPIAVDVVHVIKGDPKSTIKLPGEARPFRESKVFARISGYVSPRSVNIKNEPCDWTVDIGDQVTEGQVLATIEIPELDDQIEAAQAKINQLNAQVKVAETSRKFAKSSFKRWSDSSGDGSVSDQEIDQKESEVHSTDAKVDAANAEVKLAAAELQRLLTMDKFKSVRAPFTGTITDRRVDIGDLVTAGSTSNNTPLFCIAQSNKMRIFVDVPQTLANDIIVGLSAVAVCGDHEYPGIVDRRAETINLASRTLKVEVLADNPNHTLLPGTYVQVKFELCRATPPLEIRSSALLWRTSGPQVAVIADDGRVKFQGIKIVRDMGDLVEIAGLTGNERVALNISSQAPDGEIVQANDIDVPHGAEPVAIPRDAVAPLPAVTAGHHMPVSK